MKRFRNQVTTDSEGNFHDWIKDDPNGEYMLHSDYLLLEQERDTLKRQLKIAREVLSKIYNSGLDEALAAIGEKP